MLLSLFSKEHGERKELFNLLKTPVERFTLLGKKQAVSQKNKERIPNPVQYIQFLTSLITIYERLLNKNLQCNRFYPVETLYI